jgi:carbamoyltransferase
VLVNTSFNMRGEPIACALENAFRYFMGTEMDTLVIGNAVLRKDEQLRHLAENYKNRFKGD